jgi:hypothetical protein
MLLIGGIVTKHINDCPGLDHDRCRICGYIPTEHHLNYLKNQIDKAQKPNTRGEGKKVEDLQLQLKLAIAKHRNHQWSILELPQTITNDG